MANRLQVHLNAKNLKNLGGILSGVSNPFAVITVRGDSPNNPPHVLGQTDVYVFFSAVGFVLRSTYAGRTNLFVSHLVCFVSC